MSLFNDLLTNDIYVYGKVVSFTFNCFRCVRRYEGHLNRSYTCGLDLSPCGRYLATGSEDKTVSVTKSQ